MNTYSRKRNNAGAGTRPSGRQSVIAGEPTEVRASEPWGHSDVASISNGGDGQGEGETGNEAHLEGCGVQYQIDE